MGRMFAYKRNLRTSLEMRKVNIMKRIRSWKVTAVSLVIGLIVTICYAGGDVARATAAGMVKPSARTLYIQNCARCHGADGRAQTPLGRRLEAANLTTADVKGHDAAKIARVIRNGRPEMPAFRKKLTAAQIAAIASYVRGL